MLAQKYTDSSYDPKWNAQKNLMGRTHYVDDDTLRFHKSRILCSDPLQDGLLFGLVESVSLDMNNTKRGFRYVMFDIFGTVVGTRASLDDCYKSSNAARKAMIEEAGTLNANALTLAGIERTRKHTEYEISEVLKYLAE